MSNQSLESKYQDAQYRVMAAAYAAKHKYDAEKEPEPETDIQKMARYMGVKPGDGNVSRRRDPDEELNRRLIGID